MNFSSIPHLNFMKEYSMYRITLRVNFGIKIDSPNSPMFSIIKVIFALYGTFQLKIGDVESSLWYFLVTC